MSKPEEFKEVKAHPDAPDYLKKRVETQNWTQKNYTDLKERHGKGKYIVVLGHEVVGKTMTLDKNNLIDLMSALEVRFHKDYDSLYVIPLV
jgi:hypothetical protein